MKIAMVGTEGSLKEAAAISVAEKIGYSYRPTNVHNICKRHFDSPIVSAGSQKIFRAIDDIMTEHSALAVSPGSGVFGITSIEFLAYYLYYCSADEPPEQSRNVIKNCAHFVNNYDYVAFITLGVKTYDGESKKIFGGNIALEYCQEYIMRGIINRFGIKHEAFHASEIEILVSEIIGSLPL